MINRQSGVTIAQQVKGQITWLIVSGMIQPGDHLPSIRKLAERLSINLHTVRNAYALLESSGLVVTHQGNRTKVLVPDPSRLSKSIKSIRSNTIGIIFPSLSNPVYTELLRGIQEIADNDQTMVFICNTQEQPSEAWRYLNQLLSRQVDGIIAVSQDLEQYQEGVSDLPLSDSLGIPYVSVDTPKTKGYSVNMDLENLGYQATNHLIKHGHQRIGLVTYGFASLDYRPEDLGYKRALIDAGIQIESNLISPVQAFDPSEGRRGAEKLLKLSDPPSAIFAISDSLAMGVMEAIKAVGMQIPENVAVVGFNNIPLGTLLDPPLTTFTMPGYQMGVE